MAIQYKDYRHNIQSGDIIAQSHKEWRTWKDWKTQFVRMALRSTYSHVGVAVVISGRVFILENVIPYVRLYPLSLAGDFYHIPMREADWTPELEEQAFNYIGSGYSQWDAIKAYFKNLGVGVVSECAALVWNIMYKANIHLGDKQTPDAIVLQAQLLGNPIMFVENPR